jgi:hypothetical protein
MFKEEYIPVLKMFTDFVRNKIDTTDNYNDIGDKLYIQIAEGIFMDCSGDYSSSDDSLIPDILFQTEYIDNCQPSDIKGFEIVAKCLEEEKINIDELQFKIEEFILKNV